MVVSSSPAWGSGVFLGRVLVLVSVEVWESRAGCHGVVVKQGFTVHLHEKPPELNPTLLLNKGEDTNGVTCFMRPLPSERPASI